MLSQDTAAAVCATASCVVIGVGNTLMADDGIGVAVVEALRKQALPKHVQLYDAGTALSDMLTIIPDCERLVLIDACTGGGEPGAVYRSVLPPDDWETAPLGDSLHDMNIIHALRMHRLTGTQLGEVVLIGVEPQEVILRDALSPALRNRLPEIVETVRRELVTPSNTRRGGVE